MEVENKRGFRMWKLGKKWLTVGSSLAIILFGSSNILGAADVIQSAVSEESQSQKADDAKSVNTNEAIPNNQGEIPAPSISSSETKTSSSTEQTSETETQSSVEKTSETNKNTNSSSGVETTAVNPLTTEATTKRSIAVVFKTSTLNPIQIIPSQSIEVTDGQPYDVSDLIEQVTDFDFAPELSTPAKGTADSNLKQITLVYNPKTIRSTLTIRLHANDTYKILYIEHGQVNYSLSEDQGDPNDKQVDLNDYFTIRYIPGVAEGVLTDKTTGKEYQFETPALSVNSSNSSLGTLEEMGYSMPHTSIVNNTTHAYLGNTFTPNASTNLSLRNDRTQINAANVSVVANIKPYVSKPIPTTGKAQVKIYDNKTGELLYTLHKEGKIGDSYDFKDDIAKVNLHGYKIEQTLGYTSGNFTEEDRNGIILVSAYPKIMISAQYIDIDTGKEIQQRDSARYFTVGDKYSFNGILADEQLRSQYKLVKVDETNGKKEGTIDEEQVNKGDVNVIFYYQKNQETKPTDPTNPSNPTHPSTPAKPTNPITPITSTNSTNPSNSTHPSASNQLVKDKNQSAAKNAKESLPQTGDSRLNIVSLIGILILVSVSMFLSIFKFKKTS